MKARVSLLFAALCLFAAVAAAADSPFMGTWKLNDSKSKLGANAPHNDTVVYEAAGDNVKVTVDGKDASGNPNHNEWTGKFDGKDYPVTGDAASDSRSYKQVNAHTLAMTIKKDGKVTQTGRIVVSADGKSRTVTTTSTGSDGKKSQSKAVFDKQ
ncbi:MAG: hypothetical protein JOZ10_03850 [Acidobacteria bacterium]|nr:hypothetical protein [Acidobacteriota bacterium]MBV9145221.1 hypothetical protein [Acidobacteriota bacterium]MBV9436364.1 hypothetical protein [Acidobacteriota bacterium]